MPDVFTPEERSRVMRAVKSTGTAPERAARRAATALGRRYRLHRKDLPGSPDLVFAGLRKAVFVHGCFWHGHRCKRGARMPATNRDYWERKIARNVLRDRRVRRELRALGWRALVLWECQIKDAAKLERRLERFLSEA